MRSWCAFPSRTPNQAGGPVITTLSFAVKPNHASLCPVHRSFIAMSGFQSVAAKAGCRVPHVSILRRGKPRTLTPQTPGRWRSHNYPVIRGESEPRQSVPRSSRLHRDERVPISGRESRVPGVPCLDSETWETTNPNLTNTRETPPTPPTPRTRQAPLPEYFS